MNFNVVVAESFVKHSKRLIKKYPSLKTELTALILSLEKNPIQGVELGNNCFKIRLAIKSKNRGKSGGARVITFIAFLDSTITLLTIYDKNDKDNITDKELEELINKVS